MSMLASLVRAYDRLPDAPPFGFSTEKIGFCVLLNADGSVASVEDLRDYAGKRPAPRSIVVPATPKRSGSTPRPNFLWDNINYALGGGKLSDPADKRFDSFRDKHLEYLSDSNSPEVRAFCEFLKHWNVEDVGRYFPPENLPTDGIVFAMSDTYREYFLHQTVEMRNFWNDNRSRWIAIEGKSSTPAACLVTGKMSPIARTHPPIKGMSGAGGKSEMALISFNDNAYESYGHEQGDNAPVSEAAAFAYTTVLNRFLDKDSGHRIQIGDASTVFWADCSDMKLAAEAEVFFAALLDSVSEEKLVAEDERLETAKIHSRLDSIRNGQRLSQVAPELAEGVRFHVLGLAPNAARLSVRFYWQDDFGRLTGNFQQYLADMAIDPPPRDGWPPLWRYLLELASQGKRENVPPLIAGEWLRAILTGTAYPLTLLSTVLMRMRADGEINALRCAMLKSVLIRNFHYKETPVALDPTSRDTGYVLGRLFAVYENIQRAALGKSVNATIRDKFYGSASATPARVFGSLAANAFNHLARIRKDKPAFAHYLQAELQEIANLLDVSKEPFPASLSQEAQAKFALGYYHQASFRKNDDKTPEVSQ
ncbi:CRISPR-associated protein, Csd1 family [Paracoccus aminovorans]|uniref:CRISPR-associated protein, Csd1 family n=1 Tax=Paracoccus aminovorans TaxID=34004 RepID=A0A1I3FBP6_9RHOB|nr:type I-C CRISPR-associated protein Cas8c/Csd1 [Paracoccus aminovorans]CQR87406.1 Csd1 family CRISPR-associated protein [Paracoccus aminovorans]SFI08663.1 CRISPR-associated protein, Csd1 family [Paracoccus aminovorans]